MIIPFNHHSQAHCESGVTSNLLNHYGLPISEPMAFGIGSGLFFGHLPFIKVNGVPGTTYRIMPGQIFSNVCKRLNIKYVNQKFKDTHQGMLALTNNVNNNIPTGCQVSVFYLPFLPEAFRFHFNAHNLIVFGEENKVFHVSDPVLESTVTIDYADLAKARYAKGFPEPKGRMYYITQITENPDLITAIKKGIKQTIFFMTSPPIPWFGVNAIKYLAKQIAQYPTQLDARRATLYIGNIIRMQEEIGTGGAGFRFLYAAFLQEVYQITQKQVFSVLSQEMTAIGDQWRNFAYSAARICKSRTSDVIGYTELSQLLLDIYERERHFYGQLKLGLKEL